MTACGGLPTARSGPSAMLEASSAPAGEPCITRHMNMALIGQDSANATGMQLTGISIGNAAEAGLGALWGEDPPYSRTDEAPFHSRIGHIIKMTFLATGPTDGPCPLTPATLQYRAIILCLTRGVPRAMRLSAVPVCALG